MENGQIPELRCRYHLKYQQKIPFVEINQEDDEADPMSDSPGPGLHRNDSQQHPPRSGQSPSQLQLQPPHGQQQRLEPFQQKHRLRTWQPSQGLQFERNSRNGQPPGEFPCECDRWYRQRLHAFPHELCDRERQQVQEQSQEHGDGQWKYPFGRRVKQNHKFAQQFGEGFQQPNLQRMIPIPYTILHIYLHSYHQLQIFLAHRMNNLVQCVTFLEMVVNLQQWSLPCPYFMGFSSGQYILEAIIVMSIRSRIFWKGGSFTLKLDVPLKVTTFGRGLLLSFFIILGQLSSIETFTAQNVSTLDWNIKKSEVSTLTTIEGIINLTHIMFLSGEYYMKKSISERGRSNLTDLDSQAIISQFWSRAERQVQNSCFGFYWSSTLKLTLLVSFQFLLGLPQLKCWLIVWKNSSKLQLICFSLFLRAQLSFRFLLRSWLYSSKNFSSLLWYSLNNFILSVDDWIRSKIELFLILQSMEYQQNMFVCYRAWKKKGQFDQQKEQLVICLYCCMKESK